MRDHTAVTCFKFGMQQGMQTRTACTVTDREVKEKEYGRTEKQAATCTRGLCLPCPSLLMTASQIKHTQRCGTVKPDPGPGPSCPPRAAVPVEATYTQDSVP